MILFILVISADNQQEISERGRCAPNRPQPILRGDAKILLHRDEMRLQG